MEARGSMRCMRQQSVDDFALAAGWLMKAIICSDLGRAERRFEQFWCRDWCGRVAGIPRASLALQ